MNLLEELKKYKPYNEQEERDKEVMIKFIDTFDDVLTRNNEIAHFTASSWVLNKEGTKVLMIYHNIYDSWSWTGGHTDGEEDLLNVALREVKEETGIKNIKPIKEDIFSIETITVDGHIKNGKYVSSHLHMNVTYLLQASENEELFVKPDENSGVMWVDIDKSIDKSNEPWMKGIYIKLNEKLER
ncbi:NUDIX hydrolase [Clostridium oceanicum]|uniref:NUDIX hydrolase n=1 Tax=Clostridium oceanicum TaxID=1543 RepID=A0ABP3UY54_9CLOT